MEATATKPCDACLTAIDARATRCPHCLSRQAGAVPLHRGRERLIAGVCSALAAQLGVDPVLVRVAFGTLAAVTGGAVIWVYLMLWVATPPSAEGRAPLGLAVDWLNRLVTPRRSAPEPEVGGTGPASSDV